MDPFDIEPSPEEQAAAIVAALRQRSMGNANLAVGGQHLQRLGQAQVQQADRDMGRQQDAQQFGLLQALKKQGGHYQKTPEELAALESLARLRDAQAKKMANPPAPDPLKRALNSLRVKKMEKELAGGPTAKDLDSQVETLSKRMENAPAIKNDLETISEFSGRDDLPGVGVVEGMLPSPLLGSEGTRLRQAAKGLAGTYLKERSGTAASDAEVKRLLEEMGMGDYATDEQFKLGMARLESNVRGQMKAKEAGARPEAVQEARRRGLTTSEDIPSTAKAGRKAVKNKQGKIIGYINPDGSEELVP